MLTQKEIEKFKILTTIKELSKGLADNKVQDLNSFNRNLDFYLKGDFQTLASKLNLFEDGRIKVFIASLPATPAFLFLADKRGYNLLHFKESEEKAIRLSKELGKPIVFYLASKARHVNGISEFENSIVITVKSLSDLSDAMEILEERMAIA